MFHVLFLPPFGLVIIFLSPPHTGGAAVKAGVQEGDRIIKVRLIAVLLQRTCNSCDFTSLAVSPRLAGQRLLSVFHVSSRSREDDQM